MEDDFQPDRNSELNNEDGNPQAEAEEEMERDGDGDEGKTDGMNGSE